MAEYLDNVNQYIEGLLIGKEYVLNGNIKSIAIVIVVNSEFNPIKNKLEKYFVHEDKNILMNLAINFKYKINDFDINLIKLSNSEIFNRHYSGYTQISSVIPLIVKNISPDLIISYGTSGSFEYDVGDMLSIDRCYFIDRIRKTSLNDFAWGIYGGDSLICNNLNRDFHLKQGNIGSQINYDINDFQLNLINKFNIKCLDMESASMAQILTQLKIPFLVFKTISNKVYLNNTKLQEAEYKINRDRVSEIGANKLYQIIQFLNGKNYNEL